jgi:phage shock protein PspC (stress-responsive transcriptional regulator)
MNRTIFDKLKSRKLWAALVGVIVGLAAAFGIDSGEYVEIAGVVTSCVSVVSYIFAEGAVDA